MTHRALHQCDETREALDDLVFGDENALSDDCQFCRARRFQHSVHWRPGAHEFEPKEHSQNAG